MERLSLKSGSFEVKRHPKSGPRCLVAACTKGMEEQSFGVFVLFCFVAYLPSFSLASSSNLLRRFFSGSRTYFRIPMKTERSAEPSSLWSKQLPDPWPFCQETTIVGLAGPQLVSHSNLFIWMKERD